MNISSSKDQASTPRLRKHRLAPSRPANGEKTASRTLKLLSFIGERGENVTAKGIAREMGISLASTYNLLNSLIQEGYVERMEKQRGYRLGPMIALLYQRSLSQSSLVSDIEPVMKELAERTGQRTYLSLHDDERAELAEVKPMPGSPKIPEVEIKFRKAEHALAIGKILISSLSEEQLEAYMQEHPVFETFTSRTIANPDRLRADLRQAHSQGFATDLEEFAEGFCCIVAPIRNTSGEIEASIGISVLTRRFRKEARHFAKSVLEASNLASSMRGYKIPDAPRDEKY